MVLFPYGSIGDGLLGERLRVHSYIEVTVRAHLDHQHPEKFFFRIDEEVSPECAAPPIAGHTRLLGLCDGQTGRGKRCGGEGGENNESVHETNDKLLPMLRGIVLAVAAC